MNLVSRIVGYCVALTLLLTLAGCPAVDKTIITNATWTIVGNGSATVMPGNSQTLTFTANVNGTALANLNFSVESLPTGWTSNVSPTSASTSPGNSATVNVIITPPLGTANGDYTMVFRATNGTNTTESPIVITISNSNLTTALELLQDFQPGSSGEYVAQFRITNGAPGAVIGSVASPTTDFFRVYQWYRPDNVLLLGANQTADYSLVAVPKDTTIFPGTNNFQIEFQKNSMSYTINPSLTAPAYNDFDFKIDPKDVYVGRFVSGTDLSANFVFTVILPAGNAGKYTLTLGNLHPSLSAVIVPAVADIDAGGTPVSFDVTINRTTDHPEQNYAPYEFIIQGRHDSKPTTNINQLFSVNSLGP